MINYKQKTTLHNLKCLLVTVALFFYPANFAFSQEPNQTKVVEVRSLDQALIEAYKNNSTLKLARGSVELAQEEIIQETSKWLPQLGFNFGLGLNYQINNLVSPSIDKLNYPMRETLSLSQLIYDSHLTQTKINVAKYSAKASEQSYLGQEQEILHQVAVLYNTLLIERKKLAVSKATNELIESQLKSATERSKFGEISELDLAMLEASYAGTLANMSQQSVIISQAELNFENLTGAKLSDQELEAIDLSGITIPNTEEEIVSLALKNHNQLNAQQFSYQAAKEYFDLAKNTIVPVIISLEFMASWNQDLDDLAAIEQNQLYNLGLNVHIPFYSGGREGSQIRQARINMNNSQTNLTAIKNNTIASAKVNFRSYQTSSKTIEASKKALSAYRKVAGSSKLQFDLGLSSASDLLETNKQLLESELALLDAVNLNTNTKINILKLLGNFSASKLDLDLTLYQPDKRYDRIKSLFFYIE